MILLAEMFQMKQWLVANRMVPLSEGRIETDGTLQCAYHGWRFNAEGTCTTIPQAENSEAERKSAGHPRACVAKYPVQVCFVPGCNVCCNSKPCQCSALLFVCATVVNLFPRFQIVLYKFFSQVVVLCRCISTSCAAEHALHVLVTFLADNTQDVTMQCTEHSGTVFR